MRPARWFALRARILIAALSVCAGLTLIACDSKKDEADLEAERTDYLIWTYVLSESLTDSLAACGRAVSAGRSCASAAGAAALYTSGYLQTGFGVTATSDTDTICLAYPDAGVLASYSNAARVCWFDCETAYWNTGMAQGACSAGGFTAYANSAFATIQTCSDACRAAGTFFIY